MNKKLNLIKSFMVANMEDSNNGTPDLEADINKANSAVASISVDTNMKVNEENLEENVDKAQDVIGEFQDKKEVNMESRNGVNISYSLPKSIMEGYLIHPSITFIGSREEKQKFLMKNRMRTIEGLNAIKTYLTGLKK